MTFKKSNPQADKESKMDDMLAKMQSKQHAEDLAIADSILQERHNASEALARADVVLKNSTAQGDFKKLLDAEEGVAARNSILENIEARIRVMRGDYIDEAQAEVSQAQTGPTPLTTNEIANCFDGLKGWNRARWKSELGSPDKWLKDCRERPGTRGRSGLESTWWPVLIAAALVRQDPKMARTVKARFKRQEPLMPWLDVLEVNIPDDTDSL